MFKDTQIRDVQYRFLTSVRFLKNSEWVWFGSDIIVIYYSCNSKYYSNSGWHDFDVTQNNDNK